MLTLNADGTYTYVPAPGFTGTVPVLYFVKDDNINPAKDPATLTIEVIGRPSPFMNNPPVAQDDTKSGLQDSTVTGNVILPNDTDPDGDPLKVSSALADLDGDGQIDDVLPLMTATVIYGINFAGDTVVAGVMTLNMDGSYTFDADPLFTGKVPVDYTIMDPGGLMDAARLVITIEPNNGNTTFTNDDANLGLRDVNQTGNILTNDDDPEGDPQTVDSIYIDTNGDGIAEAVAPGAVPIPVYQGGILIGAIQIDHTTGAYVWDPAVDFIGTAVIPYKAVDSKGPLCRVAIR
jgi:hypothetical protein